MPKYYVKSGTLEVIIDTKLSSREAAGCCLWEATKQDKLDHYMTVDERGFRKHNKASAYFKTEDIMQQEGWYVE